ncbi:MAG TPA: hypothetical protein VK172_14700 [Lentimicrobium sp.]|nr:hypothetical protein [Bacteroidales bacterium]HLO92411.1 hypothetical protein [Lentimicrobium sp.]
MSAKKKAEILEKLRDLSRTLPVLVPAVVKAVHESDSTCTIEIDELEFKARLNAAEGSEKGFILLPEVGSWILAGRLDETGDYYQVLAFTSVTKITLNKGQNGGLVIVSDLVSRLNKIEQDINSLKQVFSTWTPVTQDGGAALKVASATWMAQQLTQTTASDIEDDKIVH